MGWFDDVVGTVSHWATDAEHKTGSLLDDGAHAVGGALSSIGLTSAGQWVDQTGDDLANDLGAQVPEMQLGQSTDPTQLIHGDPGALRSTASQLRTFSGAFGETAAGLEGIDTSHWTGAAADAFRAKYAPEPPRWRRAQTACGDGANALGSYADTVQWAQGQAQHAIDVYESGQRATAAAVTAYNTNVAAYNQAAQAYDSALAAARNPGARPTEPASFTDPGAELRTQAEHILTSARQERDRAAGAAAAKVRTATDLAPAEPSFGQQLLDDLHDGWDASQLANASFGAGFLNGVAGIVKEARSLNPLDPWNMTHLAEYADGVSATAAGLIHDDLHPMDALQGIVGTGWGSDPAEAAGNLFPQVLLAVATDGAGADADAARLPDDMDLEGDPVDVATGDVVMAQTDVTLPGVLPLVIRRVHRSSYRAGRWFGPSWASTLDQRLEVSEHAVCFAGEDTVILRYPHPGEDGEPVLPSAGARWPLTRDGSGYTVTDPQAGLTWRFEPASGYYVSEAGLGELPLVSVTDRGGHQITIARDLDGAPAAVVHDGGYRVLVTTTADRVTALDLAGAGPDGADVTLARFGYDAAGHLAQIVNSTGQPQRLSYDEQGRLAGWEDRNGWSYRYAYDEQGRCVRGDGPDGALSGTFTYDTGNRITRHTDTAGAITSYEITDRFQVAAVTDPLGNVTRSEHDQYGRLISRTDPLGRTIGCSYDQDGNLATVTRPDGTVASARYGEPGLPTVITEPDGATWHQEFDAAGNLLRTTGPDGAVTAYGYDQRDHLAYVTNPDGATTRVACDETGLPVTVTGPDGGTTRYGRNGSGRITVITQPDGRETRLEWTAEGRLISRVFPSGAMESYGYDGEGNLTSYLDPAAGLTKVEYTCFNQVAARTTPDGTRTEFRYDHAMRLTDVGFAGNAWHYDFDLAGRLLGETDYNGAITRYRHDEAGQLTEQVNAVGQRLCFAYDPVGNLVERRDDSVVTTFTYDPAGRLVYAANPDAEVVLERDAAGRVITESCNDRAVRSDYDLAGRRVWRVTPSGAETVWHYDEAGRPLTLHAGGRELRFSYDLAGRETSRDLPGDVTLAQEWNLAGRLVSQVLAGRAGPGQILQHRSYAYRADGSPTGVQDLLSGSRSFALDAAGRVTRVAGPGWDERYQYDAAGNITSAAWPVPPSGTAAAWADTGSQGPRDYTGSLITRAGDIRYRHDAQGRVTSRQKTRLSRKPDTWQYRWNADSRLAAVTTPDRVTWRYLYDPLGRRIAKQRLDADGYVTSQTYFIWDGLTLAEQATVADNAATADGSPAANQILTWDYRPGTFTPLTQTEVRGGRKTPQDQVDRQFYAIVSDLVGAPSELVGADGELAGYQQHTLWGTTLWKPGGASTPLRFPGQYADSETGLHYNHNRYYDPVTGRYLTSDPLGLVPGPNPDAYVSNPCVLADPLGLEGTECGPSGTGDPPDGGSGDNPGDPSSPGPGKWMSPKQFASSVAREVRNLFRSPEGATETGQHGEGLLRAAQELRQRVKSSGWLPEINEQLLKTAKSWEAKARSVSHGMQRGRR
jgi:RHS repeat-associated protein